MFADLSVARHRLNRAGRGVQPEGVPAALTLEPTSVRLEMAEQFAAFHYTLHEDRCLLGSAGRSLKCLVASVLQDQFNRRTEVLQTLFPGFALAIGFGHFRAECNEPFSIALNDCRVAISHDLTLAGAIPLRNLAVRRWGVANTVVD